MTTDLFGTDEDTGADLSSTVGTVVAGAAGVIGVPILPSTELGVSCTVWLFGSVAGAVPLTLCGVGPFGVDPFGVEDFLGVKVEPPRLRLCAGNLPRSKPGSC